jgi:hypothetical protein
MFSLPFAKRRTGRHALMLGALLLLADIGGIVHSFRMHGVRDGIVAIVLPPLALYRSVESLGHRSMLTEADVKTMVESDSGRREIAAGLVLKPEVWSGLLALVSVQESHMISSTMQELGTVFSVTVSTGKTGPVTLSIRGENEKDLLISMVDDNRDQTPEVLRIVRTVNGKPEEHVTPLEQFSSDESSQFLLAWRLAWGTIAEEQKARAQGTSAP